MAYTQGSWRTREDSAMRVPMGLKVPADLRGRVRTIADQLKGRWDMAGIFELGVHILEKSLAGETVDVQGMAYRKPEEMTREEQRQKLRDFGVKGVDL